MPRACAVLRHGQRLHFRQVGPEYVQCHAAQEAPCPVRGALADNEEVAQVLVDLAHGARQHVAALSEQVHEVVDVLGVAELGLADRRAGAPRRSSGRHDGIASAFRQRAPAGAERPRQAGASRAAQPCADRSLCARWKRRKRAWWALARARTRSFS